MELVSNKIELKVWESLPEQEIETPVKERFSYTKLQKKLQTKLDKRRETLMKKQEDRA
jgi:hypothetical protein